jgi:hypothetical protein
MEKSMNKFLIPFYFLISTYGCGLDVIEISLVEKGQVAGASVVFPSMASFSTELVQALGDKQVDPSDVDSLRLKSARLVMSTSNGSNDNLSFIRSIRFLVSAKNLNTKEIAASGNIPNVTSVKLEVPAVELKPYLQAGSFVIQLRMELDSPPINTIDLEVALTFRVDANVI